MIYVYHGSPIQNLSYIKGTSDKSHNNLGSNIVAASTSKSFAACYGYYWQDDTINQSWDNNDPENIRITLRFVKEINEEDLNKPFSIYTLSIKGFKSLPSRKNSVIDMYNQGPVKVIEEEKHENWLEYVKRDFNVIKLQGLKFL